MRPAKRQNCIRGKLGWRAALIWISAATLCCVAESTQETIDEGFSFPDSGAFPVQHLRIDAPRTTVILSIDSAPVLDVGEFNDRLDRFPIQHAGQTVFDARMELMEKFIQHKLIVLEGERRRPDLSQLPVDPLDPYAKDRILSQAVIKASVLNPDLVSDGEARQYLAENPGKFDHLAETTLSPLERGLYVKVVMIDEDWRQQLNDWRARHQIEIASNTLGGQEP